MTVETELIAENEPHEVITASGQLIDDDKLNDVKLVTEETL